MKQSPRRYQTQLAVVGSGLAGFAASIFALERGISTAQVGNTGAIAYTTGYLDLLGGHRHRLLEDPWQGLEALRGDEPDHPLSRIGDADIRSAFHRFTETISEMGIGYSLPGERNLFALTPAGTRKPTLSVPRTMLPGVEAMQRRASTVIVDLVGLNGFSATELVANIKDDWPRLSAARLSFPDMESGAPVFPEVIARALEVPEQRQRFAERLRDAAGDAEYIGMPAVMGMHRPDRVHADLQKLVGLPLFEIPTMPPSVPGIRLREMFEQAFPARGLTLVPQQKVRRVELNADGMLLYLQDSYGEVEIEAQVVLLATGRFLSGGLAADRAGVRETLLGIPVAQPPSRADWYRRQYFDPRGHAINRSGIQVDDRFRPLDKDGEPVSTRLFAAGVVLAHQDWTRQRCGAGVAIASAYRAIQGLSEVLRAQA